MSLLWSELSPRQRHAALEGMTWQQRQYVQACLDTGSVLHLDRRQRPLPIHALGEIHRINARLAELRSAAQ